MALVPAAAAPGDLLNMDPKELIKLAMAADLEQTRIERIRLSFESLRIALNKLGLEIDNHERLIDDFIKRMKEKNGTKETVGD